LIQGPPIAIIAEGDRVALSFKSVNPTPKDPTLKYTTASFEMIRVERIRVV